MTSLIEFFRSVILGVGDPPLPKLVLSIAMVLVLLGTGLL